MYALFSTLPDTVVVCALFAIGMLIAVIHVFTDRKKTYEDSLALVLFSLAINLFVAVSVFNHTAGFLPVIALLNLAASVGSRWMYIIQLGTPKLVSDTETSRSELAVGTAGLLIIIIANHLANTYWAVTVSLSVFYSSLLNRVVTAVILNKFVKW